MANRARKNQLKIYVTDEELKMILENKNASGFKHTSTYIRKMAIEGRIFNIDNSPMREATSSFTRISTNINQIAKRVNSTSTIYSEYIQELKEMINNIWQSLQSILSKLP